MEGIEASRGGVLLRADGDQRVGTGHLMRCHAVAEVLAEWNIAVHLVAVSVPDGLRRRFADAGVAIHASAGTPGSAEDLDATLTLARRLDAKVMIADGHDFVGAWLASVRAAGLGLVVFDDHAMIDPLPADVVINAAPDAARLPYRRIAPEAELLLGPTYAPLRREFRLARGAARQPLEDRRHLLISFGGSDPLDLTGRCVEALARLLPENCVFDVAVGAANPCTDALETLGRRLPGRILVHENTPAMSALMARAGLAVSAAGTTTAELACLEVPSVLVTVASNQDLAATQSSDLGWCLLLDGRSPDVVERVATTASALWADSRRRGAMAAKVSGIVDGEGATRIAEAARRLLDRPPSHPTGP